MASVKGISELIRKLHEELHETSRTVESEALHFKPDENAWSVAQILAHVAEFEHFFSNDVVHVKINPGTKFGRTMEHEARLQAVQLKGMETLDSLLKGIQQSEQETLQNLSQLSDEDLLIEGTNPKFGNQTIEWEIGHFITEHLEKHIGQLKRTYQAYLGQK